MKKRRKLTPEQRERRSQRDRDRYIAHHEERKAHQLAYYAANRFEILRRKRDKGLQQVIIHH